MNNVLVIHKMLGETPLQALDRLRIEKPEFKNEKLSYAGRLDPMAEGLLLVMVGDANKERKKYLGFDKTYYCEAMLGVSTDTYDILGLIEKISDVPTDYEDKVKEFFRNLHGKIKLQYPKYSSKTIKGEQLHSLSRKGEEFELPEREVEIYQSEIVEIKSEKAQKLENIILDRINLVKGDFRQKETIEKWKEFFTNNTNNIPVVSFRIKCSSGTYVRSIVEELGNKLGSRAVSLRIVREGIGEYGLT